MNDKKFVEYKCSYCGATITRATNAGRPMPGVALEKARLVTVAQNRIHGLLTENFKESYNV